MESWFMSMRLFSVKHEPGFRFNLGDLLLLLFLGGISVLAYRVSTFNYYYLLPVYVGASFFLFCNVFRIGNRPEAVWYVTFVVLCAFMFGRPELFWPVVLGVCEPLKLALILWRIRQPAYEGIFARKT